MYASRLAAEIKQRTGAHFFGMGGARMAEAGVDLIAHSSEVAVSGIQRSVEQIAVLRATMARLSAEPSHENLRLAISRTSPASICVSRAASRKKIPCVCFVAPQFWAWRPWRAKQIGNRFERALCIFPFEEEFYRKAGVARIFHRASARGYCAPIHASRGFSCPLQYWMARVQSLRCCPAAA